MAPEHWSDGIRTPRADIYRMGIILYQMLAVMPFKDLDPLDIKKT